MFKRQSKESAYVADIEFCPFNPSHAVKSAKMGQHLIKCRADYLRQHEAKGIIPDMANCRYCQDRYAQVELQRHEKMCPHQYIPLLGIKKLTKEEKKHAEAVAELNRDTQGPFYGEENWDNDPPHSTTMGYIIVPDNQLRTGPQLREKMREIRLEKEKKEMEIAAEKQRKFEAEMDRPYVEHEEIKAMREAIMQRNAEWRAWESAQIKEENEERKRKRREQAKKHNDILLAALEKRRLEMEEIKRKENIDLITFD